MTTMKALATASYGPITQLKVIDLPIPEPRAGQVRIKVICSAINPSDYKVAVGAIKILHGRNFPMVLGWDFSGTVDKVGAGVSSVAAGDEVFGFLPYSGVTKLGAFTEYTVTAASGLTRKPQGVSHATAAASATPAITALQSLRDLGRIKSGGRALIIGAAGGVGALGIGVAHKLGATVTAVCSTRGVALVERLGADEIIDRKKQDPLAAAKGPYDVVFDAAAANTWTTTRHLLASGGTYVTTLPSLAIVMHVVASTFTSTRARMVLVKPKAEDLALLAGWLTEGLEVPIDATVPVRDAVAAIERLVAGNVLGRIAVDVAGGF